MKRVIVVCLVCLMGFASVSIADEDYHHVRSYDVHHGIGNWHLGHMSLDIDDGTIILESTRRRSYDIVEITEDYDLYVNGDEVKLDSDQRKLVKESYDMTFEIIERAKDIGIEGAKIGAEGAKIGLSAIGGLFKMLFTDYDEDDFEEDIEEQAERLEVKAEKLEDWAEDIEDMVEDLEDTFDDMMDEIPELDELDW